MNPTCYYCDVEMTMLSKDRLWHICPSCFTQEPKPVVRPRARRLLEGKEA